MNRPRAKCLRGRECLQDERVDISKLPSELPKVNFSMGKRQECVPAISCFITMHGFINCLCKYFFPLPLKSVAGSKVYI